MQHSFRVLLVEDDDSLRVCLCEFLADFGWAVAATDRGQDAIRLAQEQVFDFSILDFHLPDGTNGLQVFQAIRRIRPLPAILMSGAASREETARARQAGFFTFLRKPLELQRLRCSVDELIAHYFGSRFGGQLAGRDPFAAPQPSGDAPLPPGSSAGSSAGSSPGRSAGSSADPGTRDRTGPPDLGWRSPRRRPPPRP